MSSHPAPPLFPPHFTRDHLDAHSLLPFLQFPSNYIPCSGFTSHAYSILISLFHTFWLFISGLSPTKRKKILQLWQNPSVAWLWPASISLTASFPLLQSVWIQSIANPCSPDPNPALCVHLSVPDKQWPAMIYPTGQSFKSRIKLSVQTINTWSNTSESRLLNIHSETSKTSDGHHTLMHLTVWIHIVQSDKSSSHWASPVFTPALKPYPKFYLVWNLQPHWLVQKKNDMILFQLIRILINVLVT